MRLLVGMGGLGIGEADLPHLAGFAQVRPVALRGLAKRLVLRVHDLDPAPCRGVPAHIGADERGIV